MSPLFRDGQWKVDDDFPDYQSLVFSLLFWKHFQCRWCCFYRCQRCQSDLGRVCIEIVSQTRQWKQHLVGEFLMITSDRSDVSKINASHHNKPQEEGRRARPRSRWLARGHWSLSYILSTILQVGSAKEDFIRSISTGLTGLVGHRIWFFLVTTDRDLNFSREIPIRDRPQCQCSTDTISTNNRHLCSLIISVRTGSRYKTNGSCLDIKYNLIPTDKNNTMMPVESLWVRTKRSLPRPFSLSTHISR